MATRFARAAARNWRLKVIALLVACGMWVGVVYARNPPAIATVQVPVQTLGLASDLVLLPTIPGGSAGGTIAVKVAGVRSNVRSPNVASELSAYADLSSIKGPGRYSVPVHVIKTDSNVELWSVPTHASLLVDKLVTASLPVHVQVASGQLPPTGYSWSSSKTTVSPATVTVRAPSSVITQLEPVVTISLAQARSSVQVTEDVSLLHQGGLGAHITFSPSVVTVNAVITSQTSERTVVVYVVTSGQPASGFQVVGIQSSPLTVIVTGASGTITSLSSIDTQAVNLNGLTKTTSYQLPLVLPSGVTASTATVTVVVDIAPVSIATPTPSPSPTP